MIITLSRRTLRPWAEQPRKSFGKAKMQELTDSLRTLGQLQPLIVRKLEEATEAGETHEIIVGERRWRASEGAGLPSLDCRVLALDDREASELALMENLDRDDLTVMEVAQGFHLMVRKGWSVEEISQRSGRAKSVIYELLDLCKLDAKTQAELTDGTISTRTARTLGRIDDEAARVEALRRIVQPGTQDQPLPTERALRLVQEEYLEPQKRAQAWAKREKTLAKEHPGARIVPLREAGEYTKPASDWAVAAEKPAAYELGSHAREREELPSWGELAEKHGAERVLVPDAEGNPVVMVPKGPLMDAERSRYEQRVAEARAGMKAGSVPEETARQIESEAAAECIFGLPGGEGRHQQSNVGKREKEEEKVKEEARRERMIAWRLELGKRLQEWLMHPVKGAAADELHAKLPVLVEWAQPYSGLMVAPELMEFLGIDAEALGDGDADTGVTKWLRDQVDARGPKAFAFLTLLEALGTMPHWSPDFPEAVRPLAEALGVSPPEEEAADAANE